MEAVLELSQALVEHSASHVVVIDETGRIRYVNAAWIRFLRENRGPFDDWTTQNYFDVCQRSIDSDDTSAELALHGIREVIEGKRNDFTLEYPSRSTAHSSATSSRMPMTPPSPRPS